MITWGEVLITATPLPGREETIPTGSVEAEPGPLPSQRRCVGSVKTEQFSARWGVKEMKASFWSQQGCEPVAGEIQWSPGS